MATIALSASKVNREGLPPVCVKCGAPATSTVTQRFRVTQTALISYLVKSVALTLPVCDRHRTHWQTRLGLEALVLALTAGLGWWGLSSRLLGMMDVLMLGGLVLVVGIWRIRAGTVRASAIDLPDAVTLAGVAPAFAEAVARSGPSSSPSSRG